MTRERTIEKIRKLRNLASNQAATADEAAAAASLAAKLLMEHDIEEVELFEKNGKLEKAVRAHDGGNPMGRRPEQVAYFWRAVESFTETKHYVVGGRGYFIGCPEDVEMALYLMGMLTDAARRVWYSHYSKHMGKGQKHQNRERKGVYAGFGTAISDRLYLLKSERQTARSSSTALVVAKKAIVEDYMASIDLKLGKARNSKSDVGISADGYMAGKAGAAKVNLNRPVNSGTPNERIK